MYLHVYLHCIYMCIYMCIYGCIPMHIYMSIYEVSTCVSPHMFQVRGWMQKALDEVNAHGQLVPHLPRVPFACRWLNERQTSASGSRQLLFTFFTEPVAVEALRVASSWWFPVPREIDTRGWRFASVRWFT